MLQLLHIIIIMSTSPAQLRQIFRYLQVLYGVDNIYCIFSDVDNIIHITRYLHAPDCPVQWPLHSAHGARARCISSHGARTRAPVSDQPWENSRDQPSVGAELSSTHQTPDTRHWSVWSRYNAVNGHSETKLVFHRHITQIQPQPNNIHSEIIKGLLEVFALCLYDTLKCLDKCIYILI